MTNNPIDHIQEAISIKYNNKVYEMKSNNIDVTVLSLGEAFFDIPLYDFSSLPYPDLYHYSHSRGPVSLRNKITNYYNSEYGTEFNSADQIIITAGSKIAVYYALRSLLNAGDEVVIIEPYWVSYSEQVKLAGGKCQFIPYDEKIDNYAKYINERTKVIIVNNPLNPSGKNFSESEINKIYELAKKNNLFVISDEAYSDFMLNEKFVSFAAVDKKLERTLVVNSISKNFGISGWRIGYIISNVKKVYECLKINQHLMTCAPTPLLMFLDRYFENIISVTKPQIKDLMLKRRRVEGYLKESGLKYLPGTATFYFFVEIGKSVLGSVDFCDRLLEEYHICAVPGIGYGHSCDKFIRVSFGTESDERIKGAFEKIKKLIEETC